jgi:purine-binding chemotaxis protein CheW
MLTNTFQLKRLSSTTNDPDSLRVVVFTLSEDTSSDSENYLFALPVEAVLKAVPCPPINWVVDSGVGMTDFGSQNVTVINLSQQFLLGNSNNYQPNNHISNSHRFLILLKTTTGELSGIPVVHPPTLTDIPLSTIRSIPLSYRQIAGLGLASHMAILSDTQDQKEIKVFLLGMDKMIENRMVEYQHI